MIFYLFICGFDIYCDFFFSWFEALGLLCIFRSFTKPGLGSVLPLSVMVWSPIGLHKSLRCVLFAHAFLNQSNAFFEAKIHIFLKICIIWKMSYSFSRCRSFGQSMTYTKHSIMGCILGSVCSCTSTQRG